MTISLTRRILVALTFAIVTVPLFAQPSAARVVEGARKQVGKTLSYDPAYRRLAYPGGDVPLATGVCTDVVIRAYRHGGVDLQRLVHEDMKRAFSAYPKNWGLRKRDPNIDHRRVPNLATFFRRKGAALPVTKRASDYQPGDVVTWKLSSGVPHIGIVSDRKALLSNRHLVIHNIGSGAQEEDVLFDYAITGHYRWVAAR
jgi:hypothetical protein